MLLLPGELFEGKIRRPESMLRRGWDQIDEHGRRDHGNQDTRTRRM